jgi:hypothetical protein
VAASEQCRVVPNECIETGSVGAGQLAGGDRAACNRYRDHASGGGLGFQEQTAEECQRLASPGRLLWLGCDVLLCVNRTKCHK